MIDSFSGDYRFLSNFWYCQINGRLTTIEHLFQASKTKDHIEIDAILKTDTPGRAKRLGRKCTLRSDWNEIKLLQMYHLNILKYLENKDLQKLLLDTKTEELVEGNLWGDTYWGVCKGIGENNLGKILMAVRGLIQLRKDRKNDGLYYW